MLFSIELFPKAIRTEEFDYSVIEGAADISLERKKSVIIIN